MKFRWTMKQLASMPDDEVLRGLIAERTSNLDPYSPLANRLNDIYKKLDKKIRNNPDKTITTRWTATKYYCATCEKTFQDGDQVDRHIEKTGHGVDMLELVKP